MGIRRVASSAPCLDLVMRSGKILAESESDAGKSTGILEKMSMELQSKLGGFVSVNFKILKGLKSVRGADDLAHT
eukprot:1150850-Pelagomonas_calceolata.AAC.1